MKIQHALSVENYWKFYGGQESGIPFSEVVKIWDAGVKSVKVPKTCKWTYDNNDCFYTTACGSDFVFNDGTARENGVMFCHKCGGRIVYR